MLGFGLHIEKVERIPRASQFLWGVSAATIGLILAMAAKVVPLSIVGAGHAALAPPRSSRCGGSRRTCSDEDVVQLFQSARDNDYLQIV